MGHGSLAAKDGPGGSWPLLLGGTLAAVPARSHSRALTDVARSIGLFFGLFLWAAAALAASVSLAWNPVNSPSLAGYEVYYGPAIGNYPSKIDVGNTTGYAVPNLVEGATYHFVVTAYDASHTESGFSNDVAATVPYSAPIAQFTASTTTGPAPLALNFLNASTGSITSYAWTFGDGGTSTAASPSHVYAAAGVYTVSLTVTGPGGSNTQTRSNYVTVTTATPVAQFTGSPTSGVAPLTVAFTNTSTGSITSYAWTFGDGGTSTAASPSHVYAAAGVYTVSLTVTGPGGSNTQTRSNYVTVTTATPVAQFTGSPTSGVAPLTVAFTNTSTGSITSYAWTFGDGGTSTAASPSHVYAAAGVYTVSLTVTGPGGSNTQTRSNYVTVTTATPVAQFTGSPTSGVAPLTVAFTNTSTGSITSYAWTFGDGGTSTAASPSHVYAAAGVYTVSLTVTGPGGSNTQTRSNYVTVTTATPVAQFTGSPTSGVAPLTVAFTNTSTGSITSYAWTFGDGGTSTAASPSHVYAAAGVYTVSLTVTGPGGSNTQTRSNYVTVTTATPVAQFTGSPTSGVAPLTVAFTNTSTGSITSYAWTFGDGGTSTAASPSHVYAAAGVYTVSLTVTGPGGSNTQTRSNYVTVTTATPVAQFTGSPTSGVAPLTVAFTNTSTGSITSYAWTFGDGGTSTAASPSHVYAAAGVYTVSLTVTGPGGSNTQTRSNYVTVTTATPVAQFTGSPTSGVAPLTVAFTNTSTGSITSYAWTFGDGGTSTAASPSHVYSAAGTYTVKLTVTGPGGSNTQTRSNYVTVTTATPVAQFTGSPTSGVAPLTVAFTNTSTGSITSYAWTFGDGGTSTAASPSHVYAAAGVYTVKLTVTGPGGSNTQTRSNYVTITAPPPPPGAQFSGSPTLGGAPLTVAFTNTSTGSITSYAWTFGDGGTSTAASPSHVYSAAGTYTVKLTVTGPGGSNTQTRSNYVTASSPASSLVNASFEIPALGGGYQYDPASPGVGWTFSGPSGIQTNGSAFGALPAPDGTQTAFIQATGGLTQTLSLNAGTYTLALRAAQRYCCVAPYVQPIRVSVDGVQVGALISPASTTFTPFSITFVVAAAGAHTIALTGTDASDKTTFIDNVTLTPGAPPSSLINGGFEIPGLGSGYQYTPGSPGVGWIFSGPSGIQGNGSALGALPAPEATQTAFIQYTGSMTQTLSLNAGNHTLALWAARRNCCVAPYVQPIRVSVDGVQVGATITPASTTFAPYSVTFAIATAGAHTIALTGTDASDKTTFIDSVTLTPGI